MHDRSTLGAGDVSDSEVGEVVARLWGVPTVELLSSRADEVDYDVPSILTRGRHWVTGCARVPGQEPRNFQVFVKQVAHWSRSPMFDFVPPDFREQARDSVPWLAEPLIYGSDLADRLPDGLSMPRALAILAPDELTRVLWIEPVPAVEVTWTDATYVEAAGLLGRLSGSPCVDELARIDPLPWDIHAYIEGRVGQWLVPMLRDDEVWRAPLLVAAFPTGLRDRLLSVLDRLPELGEEYAQLPFRAAHGDACPNNLLRVEGRPGFTLIDFGFWRAQPAGHDLCQLLTGEIQMGRGTAEGLPDLGDRVLAAYAEGLRSEGTQIAPDVVRRGLALTLVLFIALSSPPVERLGEPVTDEVIAATTQRAAAASYALDLLDET
jgi:hypothetical protein